jgi:hypothetical protein
VNDTVYFTDNHAETTSGNITPANNSDQATGPIQTLCNNHLGSYPPAAGDLTTGGSVTSTAGTITIEGQYNYIRGLTLNANTSIIIGNPSSTGWHTFDTCTLVITSSGATAVIGTQTGGGQMQHVDFYNVTLKFGGTSQGLGVSNTTLIWKGGSISSGGTTVQTLFHRGAAVSLMLSGIIEGVDLSQVTTTLVDSLVSGSYFIVKDCKISPAVVGTNGSTNNNVDFVRCDTSGTNYIFKASRWQGELNTSTGPYRLNGASAGTPISWQIVTGAALTKWWSPFVASPIIEWSTSSGGGAVNVTIYGMTSQSTVPNNDDCWLNVEHLGSSSSPQGTITSGTKSTVLSTGTALTADISDWSGGVSAWQSAHTYGTFTGTILAGNASPQQVSVPKTRFYNIGDEGPRGRASM